MQAGKPNRPAARNSPRSSAGEELALEPVPHVRGPDARVVDLAVVVAAFFAREYFQRLVACAHFIDHHAREFQRDLLVAFAMHQKEWTGDLLDDAFEPEAFELVHRFFTRLRVE